MRQDERYELVDGVATPTHRRWDGALTTVGATQAHVRLSLNSYSALRTALTGRPCRPTVAW